MNFYYSKMPTKKAKDSFFKGNIVNIIGVIFSFIVLGLTIALNVRANDPSYYTSPNLTSLNSGNPSYSHAYMSLYIATAVFAAIQAIFVAYGIMFFLFYFFNMGLDSWKKNLLLGTLFGIEVAFLCYAITILAVYTTFAGSYLS